MKCCVLISIGWEITQFKVKEIVTTDYIITTIVDSYYIWLLCTASLQVKGDQCNNCLLTAHYALRHIGQQQNSSTPLDHPPDVPLGPTTAQHSSARIRLCASMLFWVFLCSASLLVNNITSSAIAIEMLKLFNTVWRCNCLFTLW